MATDTAGDVGQEYISNQTHYLVKAITFADNGATPTVGVLPPNAVVVRAYAVVTTAFNGDTTNTCSIGYSGTATGYASAIALGTRGVITSTTLATSTVAQSTVARTVIATVTSTASASAGAGFAVVEYIMPSR